RKIFRPCCGGGQAEGGTLRKGFVDPPKQMVRHGNANDDSGRPLPPLASTDRTPPRDDPVVVINCPATFDNNLPGQRPEFCFHALTLIAYTLGLHVESQDSVKLLYTGLSEGMLAHTDLLAPQGKDDLLIAPLKDQTQPKMSAICRASS